MRIAQVAPLMESVPPRGYGGTERIVSYLTEELVARGHEVVLYASADSKTRARLEAQCERALRLDPSSLYALPHHLKMLENVYRAARSFDVVHMHVDYLHFSLTAREPISTVTTLHGRLDVPDIAPYFSMFAHLPFVSISDAQRAPLPHLNWRKTVYHGVPRDLYPFEPGPGSYLVFVGRISPEKRVDRAIDIAIRCALPLKIAAKVDDADREYFEACIARRLEHPLVEFLGEIDDPAKARLLGGAIALLLPIDWPEPFGLVMIEAMACGTPVVAFEGGSIPEVIEPGVTGFVVNSVAQAVDAIERIHALDREGCRRQFERRFCAERMASDYIDVYEALCLHEVPDAPPRIAQHAPPGLPRDPRSDRAAARSYPGSQT